jgi:hypothetical protein
LQKKKQEMADGLAKSVLLSVYFLTLSNQEQGLGV